MLYNGNSEDKNDPMEGFYNVLRITWDNLIRHFDIQSDLPETGALLVDVEPYDPCMAAETIIRNMITEITQLVHRFSPWYTLPARAFGLVSFRDILTHKNEWRLAPEAIEKWNKQIELIATEIDKKRGILQVMLYVSNVNILEQNPSETIVAVCECTPPVEILIQREFLTSRNIICNECECIFAPRVPIGN